MVLRSSLLFLSRQNWLRQWVEQSSLAQGLTARFVAGQTAEQALQVCQKLNRDRLDVSLDYLGENVTSLAEAQASRDAYLSAVEHIRHRGLRATISIKLTQVGLDLSEPACRANVRTLVQAAQAAGTRVEIDMESTAYTDRTLSVVRAMHDEFGAVRAVIQSYLRRSEADIRELNRARIPVRLCKGAYKEPAALAFPSKAEVDRNYLTLLRLLFEEGTDPAVASHDERMVNEALRLVREGRMGKDRFEFQMLYGIRRDLQDRLVRDGYRLRAYVPYGNAWYPYFMRRLAERPANLLFVARHLTRR